MTTLAITRGMVDNFYGLKEKLKSKNKKYIF